MYNICTFHGSIIHGDTSTGVFRPYVPVELRHQIFQHVHGLAHPGSRATRRLISARYVWSHLARDVTAWCQQCVACQRAKIHRHVRRPPHNIPVPAARFTHIHVDLVGPLPPSADHTYLFTIIDRTTRWPEAIPLSSTSAADCAAALVHHWVARFGVPSHITSDRGPQFTSQLWTYLCEQLNIVHHPDARRTAPMWSTAYPPHASLPMSFQATCRHFRSPTSPTTLVKPPQPAARQITSCSLSTSGLETGGGPCGVSINTIMKVVFVCSSPDIVNVLYSLYIDVLYQNILSATIAVDFLLAFLHYDDKKSPKFFLGINNSQNMLFL